MRVETVGVVGLAEWTLEELLQQVEGANTRYKLLSLGERRVRVRVGGGTDFTVAGWACDIEVDAATDELNLIDEEVSISYRRLAGNTN